MNNNLFIIIMAVVVIVVLLGKWNKKRVNNKFDDMSEKKDFAGIQKKCGTYAILWGIISVIIVPIIIYLIIRDGFSTRSIKYILVGALAVYAAIKHGTTWYNSKKLAQTLSCKMSPEEIGQVWETDDDEQLFISIGEYLCDEKCSNYGANYKLILNEPEQVLYVLFSLDRAVMTEGFQGFFDEYSDIFNDALVSAARKVGCNDVANLCETALNILSADYSEEDKAEHYDTRCDEPYYTLRSNSRNIASYCAAYARNHKEFFFL